MKLRRVMIAAPKSGSGKTMITCALLQVLSDRGEKVRAYKCGPDYIDPMFHKKVLGIPSGNLDTFFTGEEDTRKILLDDADEKNMVIIEGAMGLFNGLGGVREEGSSYHLAKTTKTPVVLVVDVKGMGVRSIVALIAGFLSYDKEKLIKGVILNRISEGYFRTIKSLMEAELQISVVGFMTEAKELAVESRHLGLVMPEELIAIKERLREAADKLSLSISLSAIMEIAESAEELNTCAKRKGEEKERKGHAIIAVAKDEAFCFYYRENLSLLEKNGAELRFFSPLHDRELPPGCHGVLLGGGYPELYAEELGRNHSMHKSIWQAVEEGMPIVAECGGFMYLHSFLRDQHGIKYPMAGVMKETCFYTDKLVRFGYIEIEERKSSFLPEGTRIRGHEFHYYDSTDNGNGAIAIKPVTGKRYPCVIQGENCWLGFPHLYYPSNPAFARLFVEKAARYRVSKG